MECCVLCVVFIVMCCFGKYILAGISILLGDKESLNDFGNLCDEPIPWKDQVWSYDEKRKPGDPEPPPPEPPKWRDPWKLPDKT